MHTVLRSGGWLVAFVLALAAGAMLFSLQEKNRQIAGLAEKLERVSEEAALMRKAAEARSSRENGTPPGPFGRAASKSRAPQSPPPPKPAEPKPPAEPAPETPAQEPEKGAWPQPNAEMTMNIQYRSLFQLLNLPPETENEVRRILQGHIAERMRVHPMPASGRPGVPGVIVTDSSAFATEEERAKLASDLASVLTAEELAQFQEYQDNLPRHMIEQMLEGDLRMFAPELPDPAQQVVRQVFAEEILAAQQEAAAQQPGPPDPSRAQESAQREQEALQRGLARLAQTLDAEQYAVAERYAHHRAQLLGAAGGMAAPEEAAAPAP